MKSLIFFGILTSFMAIAQDGQYVLDDKEIFVPKLGSQLKLTTHPRFNGSIQKMFNRPGDYQGPNCYNTALIMSSLMSDDKTRYVSPEEFEALLKLNFKQVESPEYEDIVVFDALRSRGHAGFYLGDDLVFHKKSHNSSYYYRITSIEKAGVIEENEWVPGPIEDSSDQMNWPELGFLPRAYYRIQSKVLPPLDKRFALIISKLESSLIADLKTWATGKKWGMTGEYFLQDLLTYANRIKTDSYTRGVLVSLNDQLFTMLEEDSVRKQHRLRAWSTWALVKR